MIHIQIPQKSSLINFAEQLVGRATEKLNPQHPEVLFVPNFPQEEMSSSPSTQPSEMPPMHFDPSEIWSKKQKRKERSKEIQELTRQPQTTRKNVKRLATEKPERVAGLHGLYHFESGKIELKWHSQQEANFYTVQYNETSYDELQWKTLATSTSEKVALDSLEKGKEYYFRVKAHAENFSGEWSGLCCLKLKAL